MPKEKKEKRKDLAISFRINFNEELEKAVKKEGEIFGYSLNRTQYITAAIKEKIKRTNG